MVFMTLVSQLPRDFGDFGVSFASTVAGRCTRRGGPRLSVRGEPLIVLTRDHEVPPMQRRHSRGDFGDFGVSFATTVAGR